jgi:hypothetical protein
MQLGDDFRAAPFVSSAALLGGEGGWDDSLGPELRVRFYNALANRRPKGVVYAPELSMDSDFHLVGSQGPPPWIMPVGTFTFEWGERSVPINVNSEELTLVLPRTFEEFEALVDGVTESDLIAPDYDQPIFYDRREHRRQQREQREQEGEQEQEQADSTDDPATPEPAAPPVDALSFFDELADLETDDAPPLPPPSDGGAPERQGAGVSARPHLGLGGSWTITGPASSDAIVGDESYGGLGLQAALGLNLRFGSLIALRPELGFRSAGNGAALDPSQFADEGWGSSIPVEPTRNRLLLGYARMPVLLRLGALSLGAGPAWAMGSARVNTTTTCGDEGVSCIAPMNGSVMAAGGSLLLGVRPGSFPLIPWVDLNVLHDGERATLAAGLTLAWEGRQ